ncbi:MAG: ABC transporter ATP-binding protein [Myxococcota bacterium]|nr:ABC transporter ATP-binding protein [Myxococcota bacterium]
MLVVENIHKSFSGHEVLKGVSLRVTKGATRVILGLSGSGKSVLMKHMIGLIKPDSGKIIMDGEDLTQLSEKRLQEKRKEFGMVFQQSALFDSMTVWENVAFPLREHTKLRHTEIHQRVMEKLELVGLEHSTDKFPSELSGGMRKRVGLARAVILSPKCIFYDEPTTGLDPVTTDNVDNMILDASRRLQVTSIVISHDIGSAIRVADEIAVLHKGEIVEDCAAKDIRKSQHPFVRNFLDIWFGKQE